GLHDTRLALGTFGFIESTFHRQAPLTERRIMVRFELLCSELRCFQGRGCQSFEKSIDNRLIDLDAADIETVHSAPLNDILAGAMIAGRRGSTRVVRVEPTATLPTRGEALQQCAAFSHRATRLGWLTLLVGLKAC